MGTSVLLLITILTISIVVMLLLVKKTNKEVNEYERTSIKHCLINFYYDENYEISHSYNLLT